MPLYPRMRPRENADSLRDRAEGERRTRARDYAHDDRASPLRPSWDGARLASGRRVTSSAGDGGGGGTVPPTSAPERFRIAVTSRESSANRVAVIAVHTDNTISMVPGSPYTVDRGADIRGLAYGMEGGARVLYVASTGTGQTVYKINAATGLTIANGTGVSVPLGGIATNMGASTTLPSPYSLFYGSTIGGIARVGYQIGYTGGTASASHARWGRPPSGVNAREVRGLTFLRNIGNSRFFNVIALDRNGQIWRLSQNPPQTAFRTQSPGGPSSGDAAIDFTLHSTMAGLRDPQGITYGINGFGQPRWLVVDNGADMVRSYTTTAGSSAEMPAESISFERLGLGASAVVRGIAGQLPTST